MRHNIAAMLAPFLRWWDVVELWRLRRLMPSAHRAWVTTGQGIRPENSSEYLARLRRLARERFH